MLLLIDENVPNSVADFFIQRGHDVKFVRDLFPTGTPDIVIALGGNLLGATVVTWNHKDFRRLAARVPQAGERVLRNLGRINFCCNETIGRQRAEALIEWIEFEYSQVQKLPDKRLMIEIKKDIFRVIR